MDFALFESFWGVVIHARRRIPFLAGTGMEVDHGGMDRASRLPVDW
jgi:hypothetical protein